jgi:branched-chain amino acid transport system permease protein
MRLGACVIAVVAFACLPFIASPVYLGLATQILIASLFACAFNLLSGHAGLLSFGHAAYFGVGSFAVIHAMNAFEGSGLLPTPLLPLVGAAAGLAFGVAAGYFATMRAGLHFSMITLALAELLHSLAPQIKQLFGGEAGISAMRAKAWGITFGSATEVYFLVGAWVVVSLVILYWVSVTQLGLLAAGLRENAQRLRFLGYSPHRLKWTVFAISSMFSGIAGGLQALNVEAANYAIFDIKLSTDVVLFAYLGGASTFFGPILGAALLTTLGRALADMTRSWLLYQGILFVLIMLVTPRGLIGLAADAIRSVRRRGWWGWLRPAVVSILASTLLLAGVVFVVELGQRVLSREYRGLRMLNPSAGPPAIQLFGFDWRPNAVETWLLPAVLVVVGFACLSLAKRMWHFEDSPSPDARQQREAAPAAGATT